MSFSPLIHELIQALRCLPGVGPKSAQRMALFLLQKDRSKARTLTEKLSQAIHEVKRCQRCRTLSESNLCQICANQKRRQELLCIVEQPSDILALEQTSSYQGVYFVLTGHLSPIDGIGPDEIGMSQLLQRVKAEEITEVILALNATIEGQTTANYIANAIRPIKPTIKVTQLAQGIPMGSELEYTDGNTLAHALMGRKVFA